MTNKKNKKSSNFGCLGVIVIFFVLFFGGGWVMYYGYQQAELKSTNEKFIYAENKLRENLDKLDNSFIKLIKKRTKIVKEVLKLKKYKNEIVDKKRINFILRQIRKKSIKNKIDPKITNRIWKNMILSYIDYEKRNFRKK